MLQSQIGKFIGLDATQILELWPRRKGRHRFRAFVYLVNASMKEMAKGSIELSEPEGKALDLLMALLIAIQIAPYDSNVKGEMAEALADTLWDVWIWNVLPEEDLAERIAIQSYLVGGGDESSYLDRGKSWEIIDIQELERERDQKIQAASEL